MEHPSCIREEVISILDYVFYKQLYLEHPSSPKKIKIKSNSYICLVPWPIAAAQIGKNMRGCVKKLANVVRFLVLPIQ
jgi:hypothetical protein